MTIKFLLICLFLLPLTCLEASEVITFEGPEEMTSDKYYSVYVNGERLDVYDTEIASFARVDFTGTVEVVVETMFDVRWVDIRPGRKAIKPVYLSAHSFSFVLEEPQDLSIELNGRIRQQPLFFFSDLPENDIPDRTNPDVIWFEGGKVYENVSLEVKDGQTVYIEGGAVVQGNIYGDGVRNCVIRGRGMMDGRYNRERITNGRKFVDFRDSQSIDIKGITLMNATTWQLAIYHSDDISIRDVNIVSEHGGDDGMDIFRCTNVLIDGVFAHTKDDCIAIKSGGAYDPNDATDNIIVRNCIFWNSIWGNAIEIGFELYSNEVKNIRFENIDILHVEDGAAMSIHNAGQAHVHNVVFENIWVEDARQKLFDVAIFFSQWGPDGIRDPEWIRENYMHGAWDGVQYVPEGKEAFHMQYRGTISNIIFRNIYVTGGLMPFSVFYGYDEEKNISNVVIENLYYIDKKLTTLEEAKIRQTFTSNLTID